MYKDIYSVVFGQDSGQVCCPFHPDTNASSGIGDDGQFHCFTCGTSAHDSVGFISKYFNVSIKTASNMNEALHKQFEYTYTENPITKEQMEYLKNCGISDKIIQKYFFCSGVGKLMYRHTFNGYRIGTTWFNNPCLPEHNPTSKKYKYNIIKGGLCTPYDDVIKYNTLIITEGEKDMLTAKSFGFPNAVAKVGGAKTGIVAGINFQDKQIILIYDCDDPGREGAEADASHLIENYNCKVKVINLNLPDKGADLNDYFVKYNHTKEDLVQLIQNTPLFTPTIKPTQSKVETFIKSLNDSELIELKKLIKIMEDEEYAKN